MLPALRPAGRSAGAPRLALRRRLSGAGALPQLDLAGLGVGSLFCLRVEDEQVSFEVNLDSVARSGVRIHPSVLQLSRRRAAAP